MLNIYYAIQKYIITKIIVFMISFIKHFWCHSRIIYIKTILFCLKVVVGRTVFGAIDLGTGSNDSSDSLAANRPDLMDNSGESLESIPAMTVAAKL